jgi:hypothetical protein
MTSTGLLLLVAVEKVLFDERLEDAVDEVMADRRLS